MGACSLVRSSVRDELAQKHVLTDLTRATKTKEGSKDQNSRGDLLQMGLWEPLQGTGILTQGQKAGLTVRIPAGLCGTFV